MFLLFCSKLLSTFKAQKVVLVKKYSGALIYSIEAEYWIKSGLPQSLQIWWYMHE